MRLSSGRGTEALVHAVRHHLPLRSTTRIVDEAQGVMVKSEIHTTARTIGAAMAANLLLSWLILPLVIPPFGLYSLRELIEVLLWQGMGAVGWPIAILGGCSSTLLQPTSTDLGALLLILIYPTMLCLLVIVLRSKRPKRWALILLHVLLSSSFAAVWYHVLNGYDFMLG
jgi:hypothetical protein